MSSDDRPRLFGPWYNKLGITLIEPEPGYDKRSFEYLLCESAEARAGELERTIALAEAVRDARLRAHRGHKPLLAHPFGGAVGGVERNHLSEATRCLIVLRKRHARLSAIAEQGLDAL